jgi:imidazolonepropionase-like amidohydrolase
MRRQPSRPWLFLAIAPIVALVPAPVRAAVPDSLVASGGWIIHKIGHPIGREDWRLTVGADGRRTLHARFDVRDRGTPVQLSAELVRTSSGAVERLVVRGRTSRLTSVDVSVAISRESVTVATGSAVRHAAVRHAAYDGEALAYGYAPIALQQELVREWLARGRPAELRLLPEGVVRIAERGLDTVQAQGRRRALRRLSVAGLVWGRQSVWLDDGDSLVAVVTTDAEFDPVQAVRDDLHAALGTLVRRAAEDALAALAELGATARQPADGRPVALVGGLLVDGSGAEPMSDAVVVTHGGRIIAAGPRRSVRLPPGTHVVDVRGATILPGLWDMHTHFAQAEWAPVYLAAGVTTVRDLGSQLEFLEGVRGAVREGRAIGPRVLAAGIIDGSGPNAVGTARAATPAEGVDWVRRYRHAGFEQIKIYSSMSDSVLRAVATEAHRLGMTVTGHVPVGLDGFQAVEAGMDQVNHVHHVERMLREPGDTSALDLASSRARRALAFLRERGVVVDPTLALAELTSRSFTDPLSEVEPGAAKIPPELRALLHHVGVPPGKRDQAQSRLRRLLAVTRALHGAGVAIVAGTDLAVPGHSLHRELELYVEAGLTPMEAIRAATSGAAQAMRLGHESGVIRPGFRADVVVVDGNPVANIRDIRRVRLVMAAGRLLEPAPLWRSAGFEP